MGSDFDSFNASALGAFSESLLHARGGGAAVTAVGDVFLAIDGATFDDADGGNLLGPTVRYNRNADTWSNVGGNQTHRFALYETSLFGIGHGSALDERRVNVFNPATNSFQLSKTFTTAVLSLGVLGDYLYAWLGSELWEWDGSTWADITGDGPEGSGDTNVAATPGGGIWGVVARDGVTGRIKFGTGTPGGAWTFNSNEYRGNDSHINGISYMSSLGRWWAHGNFQNIMDTSIAVGPHLLRVAFGHISWGTGGAGLGVPGGGFTDGAGGNNNVTAINSGNHAAEWDNGIIALGNTAREAENDPATTFIVDQEKVGHRGFYACTENSTGLLGGLNTAHSRRIASVGDAVIVCGNSLFTEAGDTTTRNGTGTTFSGFRGIAFYDGSWGLCYGSTGMASGGEVVDCIVLNDPDLILT